MTGETQSATPAAASTVEALLRAGVRLLAPASESPRLDAEVLLAWALDVERPALYAHREAAVDAARAARFMTALRERQAGRPVAQLTGRRGFWTLDLAVTADVLTPRPETETLVERALARLAPAASVVDLGTGSGAIALAIAGERPDCTVLATDLSEAALAVARRNAAAHGLQRLGFAAGDWFEAVGAARFDVVVANPPYLADPEWETTEPALAHEPRMALAGGADGLDAIRRIVAGAGMHLRPGGWLLIEHGAGQGEAVRALLTSHGFARVATVRDLAGRDRVAEGCWP